MMLDEICTPTTVPEAVTLLAERGDTAMVLAGGTDVMVRLHRGMLPPPVSALVSLHRIPALRGVRTDGTELVIGPTTTVTDLTRNRLVADSTPILAQVADRLASPQIRNAATIGGNLINASPAGDLINPLLLLDARLVLASPAGRRTLPVAELFTGPGETTLQPGELLVEIRCQIPPAERVLRFKKAGTRPAMECSLVNLGIAFTMSEQRLHTVRVAVGSCAPTPVRARQTEAVLEGQPLTRQVVERAAQTIGSDICPVDDIRGTAAYRRALVAVYLRRLLRGSPS